eukprot:TRINITY_DN3340_c0_g1_i2.p1 TRINITY_DN3340_c0_g1~~TRINITY_DN3340_c0_g1_i2.p1  ORF type:complete len:101 (+),score=6.73 TRINITY_DN3340_c0_g1_i2:184-486(+)
MCIRDRHLIVPHLDLIVISARAEQWLGLVEVHAANRTVVALESLDESPHAEVPQLDGAAVKTRQEPSALRMETYALDSVAFGFEFSEHSSRLGCVPHPHD